MPLDQAVVGQVVTQQMESIEREHGEDDDVEIGAVISIVEVVKKIGDDSVQSTVRLRGNVADPFRTIGLIRLAEQNIMAGLHQR